MSSGYESNLSRMSASSFRLNSSSRMRASGTTVERCQRRSPSRWLVPSLSMNSEGGHPARGEHPLERVSRDSGLRFGRCRSKPLRLPVRRRRRLPPFAPSRRCRLGEHRAALRPGDVELQLGERVFVGAVAAIGRHREDLRHGSARFIGNAALGTAPRALPWCSPTPTARSQRRECPR